tara:strand:- start:103 stop:561 length:459 start_codon:yes stop_codon:yes gene_type:complete
MVEQIKRLNGQLNEDRAYDTTQVMYKGAIEIKKEITRLLKKYETAKASYEASVKDYSKNKQKEYLDIVSKAFSEDKVTSRGGKIRITFKDKNKYRSYGQILNKIPKDDGKQPMKISDAKSNIHGEISSAELVFTNQFLKSTLKLKTLPAKPF